MLYSALIAFTTFESNHIASSSFDYIFAQHDGGELVDFQTNLNSRVTLKKSSNKINRRKLCFAKLVFTVDLVSKHQREPCMIRYIYTSTSVARCEMGGRAYRAGVLSDRNILFHNWIGPCFGKRHNDIYT